jgi:hypothetical protein
MYIKKSKNGKNSTWFLCDEKNELKISGNQELLKKLENFELGSYDFLFNEEMLVQWKLRKSNVEFTNRFLESPEAWVRHIKINDILKD